MENSENNQPSNLRQWIDGFIISRISQGNRKGTIKMYTVALGYFCDYCKSQGIDTIEAITPVTLRAYLISLQSADHNPGGVRWHYRQVKSFLNWYEREDAPDGWRNPVKKVRTPSVPENLLDPVSMEQVRKLIQTCGTNRVGVRDKAILLSLLDTGARAGELVAFNLEDLDQISGTLTIRESKTGKGRLVFLGQRARRAVRAYLKIRGLQPGPLFQTTYNTRLSYEGLATLVRRRSKMAGIERPALHAFRRACAVELARSGENTFTIKNILGHASIVTTLRYVKLSQEDLRAAVERSAPGDRL